MPDEFIPQRAPDAPPPWSDLPLLTPPRSAWPSIAATLQRRRARRRGVLLALAATLAAVALLPRWTAQVAAPPPAATTAATPVLSEPARIDALMRESAQLEALIAWSREDEVETASAASLAVLLQQRIERVDALLARPDPDPEVILPLWQERVLRLRQLAGLQSSQHLLAANGDVDVGVPVLAF